MSCDIDAEPSGVDDESLDASGTIGSRLRKRRRTASIPAEDVAPKAKRLSLRKTTSPKSRRTSQENKRASVDFAKREARVERGTPSNGKERATSDNTSETISRTPEPASGTASAAQDGQRSAFPIPPPNLQLRSSEHEAARIESQRPGPAAGALPNDLQSLIANIMRYSDQLAGIGENGNADPPRLNVDSLHVSGASLGLKIQCLPILDNLVSYVPSLSLLSIVLSRLGYPDLTHAGQVNVSGDYHHSHGPGVRIR